MRKIIAITALFCCATFFLAAPGRSQTAGHIVYIRGIFASSTELQPLATAMHDNYGLSSDYIFGNYADLGAFDGIVSQAQGIEVNANRYWGSSQRVIVGHSMGGVEGRSMVQQFPSHARGYVTVDAPNFGARFAEEYTRQSFIDDFAYDRGQISRQTIGPLGSLVGGILTVVARALDFVNSFAQATNANIQDLVPNSTFMNNLMSGASGEVASVGSKRCVVFSTCISPRWPAYGSQDIVSDQRTYADRVKYCWDQNHYWDGENNRLASKTNWSNAWLMWARRVVARSRAGDYSAAANGYVGLNASWEDATAYGQSSDSFISKSSQENIGRFDACNIFQVGVEGDRNHQVNHGGAVFGTQGGYGVIHQAMVAAGAN